VSRGDLLGDLRQALVGLAAVAEPLPMVEDSDLVLPAPPGSDELGSCWKLDSRARPRPRLPAWPRTGRLSPRASDRRPQSPPGLGIDSASSPGLDPPC